MPTKSEVEELNTLYKAIGEADMDSGYDAMALCFNKESLKGISIPHKYIYDNLFCMFGHVYVDNDTLYAWYIGNLGTSGTSIKAYATTTQTDVSSRWTGNPSFCGIRPVKDK